MTTNDPKRIATVRHGSRLVCGTEWPIESFVDQVGPKRYVVTFNACNGVADGTERYRTKREALAALGLESGGDYDLEDEAMRHGRLTGVVRYD